MVTCLIRGHVRVKDRPVITERPRRQVLRFTPDLEGLAEVEQPLWEGLKCRRFNEEDSAQSVARVGSKW